MSLPQGRTEGISLRPDGWICQFMPIRTGPEKWSINYKTIDGVLTWPANVSNKNEIMPAVFGQTFLFVNPISRHLRWQKTVFFAFEFDFFWGRRVLPKIYRNISCVKSCLTFNCWAYLDLYRKTTQTIEEANSSQNSFSHQKLGDLQLIRRAENFDVRK